MPDAIDWLYRNTEDMPCNKAPEKKQSWSVCNSAGEDAHTTADLEIGATVSSPGGRLRRWTTDTKHPRVAAGARETLHGSCGRHGRDWLHPIFGLMFLYWVDVYA